MSEFGDLAQLVEDMAGDLARDKRDKAVRIATQGQALADMAGTGTISRKQATKGLKRLALAARSDLVVTGYEASNAAQNFLARMVSTALGMAIRALATA